LYFERIIRIIENIIWRVKKVVVVDCFGDSHTAIFRQVNDLKETADFRFRVSSVKGATASGINNPNSKTNTFNTFKYWLKKTPSRHAVLFMIGEVDTGFLIWLRAKKYKQSAEMMMHEAVERYTNFIDLVKDDYSKVIVCSAPLPTIKDGETLGEVANARNEIQVSQLDRTKLTLAFNNALREWAYEKDILFLDMDDLSLDKDTGLVKKSFLNKNKADHHYDDGAFVQLIVTAMKQQKILKDA